jgi:hypothetical protein
MLVAALFLAGPARADEGPPAPKPTQELRASDYRSPRFHVTQADYKANGLEIRLAQVRDRAQPGFLCRGWLRIRPAGGTPQWVYRGDIEAVGSSYGLFVPSTQPMPHFFLLVEHNGYSETLLLIDEKGKIREVPGGWYFVDFKRRLLFSLVNGEDPAVAFVVLDLDSGKTIFQENERKATHWYRLDSNLLFTTGTDETPEVRTTGYIYDAAKKTVTPQPLTPEMWARIEPVPLDFDPRWYQDCTSEERRYGLER